MHSVEFYMPADTLARGIGEMEAGDYCW